MALQGVWRDVSLRTTAEGSPISLSQAKQHMRENPEETGFGTVTKCKQHPLGILRKKQAEITFDGFPRNILLLYDFRPQGVSAEQSGSYSKKAANTRKSDITRPGDPHIMNLSVSRFYYLMKS